MLFALLPSTADLWGNPTLVWVVAAIAAGMLVASWWLLRLTRRRRVRAAIACVSLSVLLHGLLFFLIPMTRKPAGGTPGDDGDADTIVADVTFANLDPAQPLDEMSGTEPTSSLAPLPIAPSLSAAIEKEPMPPDPAPADDSSPSSDQGSLEAELEQLMPTPVFAAEDTVSSDDALDELLSSMLLPDAPVAQPPMADAGDRMPDPMPAGEPQEDPSERRSSAPTASVASAVKRVINDDQNDFAQRFGQAKWAALQSTGGNEQTEAAVEAGLRWLAEYQRDDGSWDPAASGAGVERAPLGLRRDAAGRNATTGLTGLALLAMLGSGNTHREGPYSRNVFRGLSYLIRTQAPNGSLAGDSGTFARTYCHGIAALALCEAAAITGDPQALSAAEAAVAHTVRLQHPTTGGWRYVPRDPGDMSQLGWQAMVLESGRRGGLPFPKQTQDGIFHFLHSVREGQHGGLAAYRPGERATPTMTAEALATRLLLGENVPTAEIAEAEHLMLQSAPGTGQANYYYWYYASLAMHQLQDGAWRTWNQQLKQTLVATQQPDGSWPTDSVWGGYGGRVYTTAIGCLCLEVYYRHALLGSSQIARADTGSGQR